MYTYDASGRKLEAVNYTVHNIINVPINTISTLPSNPSDYTKLTTDYVGNMIYENGSLKQILLPEGYYQGGVYYYYLKDHLGTNRLVINSSGAVIEKSHYYPSGMRFSPESTSNSAALPYRYNGKELEAMNGLNQYDYGARRRGAGLPIWTAVDPLAEKYYSISPYVYCAGNPINAIDPDGEDFVITIQRNDKNEITGITFSATVYIKGDGASKERASELNSLAKETFKSKESNGVTIGFNVNYEYSKDKTLGDLEVGKGQNLLTFTNDKVDRKNNKDSHVEADEGFGADRGVIYNKNGNSNYDVMHETMHFMGFDDRYNQNTGAPDNGYRNDIMGRNGAFDISPNHYSNMYRYVNKMTEVQQDKYLKQIYSLLPPKVYRNKYSNNIPVSLFIDKR